MPDFVVNLNTCGENTLARFKEKEKENLKDKNEGEKDELAT